MSSAPTSKDRFNKFCLKLCFLLGSDYSAQARTMRANDNGRDDPTVFVSSTLRRNVY